MSTEVRYTFPWAQIDPHPLSSRSITLVLLLLPVTIGVLVVPTVFTKNFELSFLKGFGSHIEQSKVPVLVRVALALVSV